MNSTFSTRHPAEGFEPNFIAGIQTTSYLTIGSPKLGGRRDESACPWENLDGFHHAEPADRMWRQSRCLIRSDCWTGILPWRKSKYYDQDC